MFLDGFLPLSSREGSALVLVACGLLACSRAEPAPRPDPPAALAAASLSGPDSSATPVLNPTEVPRGPLVLARGVRLVHAGGASDAARVVREERERARGDGRELVVYVGAKWCEPCRYFHKAAQNGELDGDFPDLTILEFDLDEDRERLVSAGYVSEFIPLFAIPDADGRASNRKFAGAVKGSGAVGHIAPRLRALLKQ